jgi:hypothetical protein
VLLSIAMIAVALTLQSSQSPKEKGVVKSGSAQKAANPQHSDQNPKQSAPQSTPIPSQIATAPSKPQTNPAADDVAIQRGTELFTELLVVVGFLQAGVMFLTWLVYCRQAKIMRLQAHEMKRQRGFMRLQWKATRDQLAQMESAGHQTDKLIKHAEAQVAALADAASAAKDSAEAATLNANAVINTERAWVVPELLPHSYQGKHGRWFKQDDVPLGTDEVLAGKHLIYSLKITNMGRTPAQVVSWELRYTCLPDGASDLPENAPGEFVSSHEFYHLLAGNGASVVIDEPPLDAGDLMSESLDAIRQLRKTAVFHGHVRYRHMFSEKDDAYADFCYVFTVSLNRLSRVGRYTKQR